MLIVTKCSMCGRGYTAPVTTCQICGGACGPVSAAEAAALDARPEPSPEPPRPECPCCGGERGAHTITQKTRHLLDSSLIPARRRFLVTEVTVPGVCTGCHRSLQKKRLLAGGLLLLPLPFLFGFLVIMDSKVAAIPVVLYIVYAGSRIGYSWADFLLYGRELSWKLTAYVPREDREGLAGYPVGIWHVMLRLGFLPGLMAMIAVLASFNVIKKPQRKVESAVVAAAPEKSVAGPVSAAPVNAAPAPELTAEQRTIAFLNTAHALAVPVDAATVANPKLARPKPTVALVGREKLFVVKVYADEANVPPNTPYQVMNSVTLLIHCAGVPYDVLSVEDRQILLKAREVSSLVTKVAMATGHPSEIKIKPAP